MLPSWWKIPRASAHRPSQRQFQNHCASPRLRYRPVLEQFEDRIAPAATNLFGAPMNAATNVGPVQAATGDFNGDGKLDLVVTDYYSQAVTVLLGNGQGGFAPAANYAVGLNPRAVAAADFNSDGKFDLAVANAGSDTVSILMGNGDGTLGPATNYAVGEVPNSLAVGDFNGDGKLDLAVVNSGSSFVSILMNNGQGGFSAAANVSVGANAGNIAAGDFSRNGKSDLAVTFPGFVSILMGKGNGSFAAPVTYAVVKGTTLTYNSPSIAVGDFNGNGNLDLAIADSSSHGLVSILDGIGNGTFSAAVNYAAGGNPATGLNRSIAAGDFNGDGKPDLVTIDGVSTVSVLLNNGGGGFGPATNYTTGSQPLFVTTGDFNGNGKLDFAVVNQAGNDVSVFLGNGGGSFLTPPSYALPANANSAAVGDFTGDGNLDLAVVYNGTQSGTSPIVDYVSVLLGNGNGTFGAPTNYLIGSYPNSSVSNWITTGDFNGDGKLDLAIADNQSDIVSVLLGNGNGGFGPATNYLVGTGPDFITAGDFNGNGKLDLAVACSSNNAVSILLGNGTGGFGPATLYAAGLDPTSLAVGDFNGDGKLDLVVANGQTFAGGMQANFSILMGNGNGTFGPPIANMTNSISGASAVAVGNFNGDGRLDDIAIANNPTAANSSATVSILLGNGTGGFSAPVNYPIEGGQGPMVVGDFYGNGNPDLAVINEQNHTVSILLGDGAGGFGPPTNFLLGSLPTWLAVGDLAGNNSPDLAVGSSTTSNFTVLLDQLPGPYIQVSAPADVAVGSAFDITVTARAANNNALANYSGTVQFSDTDPNAALPASSALTNGVGIFKVTLNTPGSQILTASDAAELLTGSTTIVAHIPAYFQVSQPIAVNAGVPFMITVTAVNANNALFAGYTGTLQFSSTDPSAILPNNNTLSNGVGIFSVTLNNTGNQTITVSDIAGPVTGSVTIAVAPTLFQIAVPAGVAVGVPFNFTIMAADANLNRLKGYDGTLQFASSDIIAILPSTSTLTNGVGTFSATLYATGNQTLTATDIAASGISGSSTTNVIPNYLAVTVPATIMASVPFILTVTALDGIGNTLSNYNGTVYFSDSSSGSSLPTQSTLTNGVGTFSVTLAQLGSQTLTATDPRAAMTASTTVNVLPEFFVIAAPSSVISGVPFPVTVTAQDANKNTVSSYIGAIRFTISGNLAVLASTNTLTGGVGTFTVILYTSGNQTLTVSDTAGGGTGSTSITVAPTFLTVTAPSSATVNIPFQFTVTAVNQAGSTVAGYAGAVLFSSTDAQATLPPTTTLAGGTGVFTAVLQTTGSQTITASGAGVPNNPGVSSPIMVTPQATTPLVVTSLTPTSTGFVATFNKPFDPSTINLYDSMGTWGPDDVTLTGPGAPPTSFHGSLIIDPTDTTITFVKTSTFANPINSFDPQTGVLAAGTYTVTLRSGAIGFKDLSGAPLDGTGSGNPAGSNYVTTFVVVSTPAEVVGVPGFARGPGNSVNLPNAPSQPSPSAGGGQGGGGIPISLSDGTNVTAGQFTLLYNSALLNITGATVNSALAGAMLTLDPASTPGNAVIDFSSQTALPSGPVRLGGLVATVPNAAAAFYKSKALLHFRAVQVNGGAIAAVGDNAVDVDAYLADANGDGALSAGDAALIAGVAANLDNNAATGVLGGFAAYPLADPVLIGDLTGSGSVNSADVTLMNSMLAGTRRAQIPAIPIGLTIVPTGPDPTLSLGGAEFIPLSTPAGATVIVPVNIDTPRPPGSTGMTEATLALQFDPLVFSVSPVDVQLGTIPSAIVGWQLQTAINPATGEIGIDLFGASPIQTTTSGSLVTIALHLRDAAPVGSAELSLVATVNPNGERTYQTTVSDTQGALELHWSACGGACEPYSGKWPETDGQIGTDSLSGIGKTGIGAEESLPGWSILLPANWWEQALYDLALSNAHIANQLEVSMLHLAPKQMPPPGGDLEDQWLAVLIQPPTADPSGPSDADLGLGVGEWDRLLGAEDPSR